MQDQSGGDELAGRANRRWAGQPRISSSPPSTRKSRVQLAEDSQPLVVGGEHATEVDDHAEVAVGAELVGRAAHQVGAR